MFLHPTIGLQMTFCFIDNAQHKKNTPFGYRSGKKKKKLGVLTELNLKISDV